MIDYKRIWDGGYANRRERILATGAHMQRKFAAMNRVFKRMAA